MMHFAAIIRDHGLKSLMLLNGKSSETLKVITRGERGGGEKGGGGDPFIDIKLKVKYHYPYNSYYDLIVLWLHITR